MAQLSIHTMLPVLHVYTCTPLPHTQPRRISAVSVAERVAAERCEGVGHTVGYSVRFESVLPRHYASILFCTVGMWVWSSSEFNQNVLHVRSNDTLQLHIMYNCIICRCAVT